MNERAEGLEVNIQKLVMTYVTRWWLFVVMALIVGAAAYGYSYYKTVPMYQASTTIYVNNMVEGITVDSVSSGQLYASQQLVSTYINIVKSDRVMSQVAAHLGEGYTGDRIKSMTSASQVSNTEIFAINVSSPNPEEAAKVANAIGEVVPGVLAELIEGSSARVIDTARVPISPYGLNYRSMGIRGALIGACLAFIYVTILFLMDVRIKDEEDIAMLFEYPVLGQIPEFVTSSKSGTYGYGKKKYETPTYEKAKKPSGTQTSAKAVSAQKSAVRRSAAPQAIGAKADETLKGKEQKNDKQ